MLYTYEAKDAEGQTIKGSVEAHDERTAASRVRELGYYPMRFSTPTSYVKSTSSAAEQARSVESEIPYWQPRPHYKLAEKLGRTFVYPLYTGVGARDLAAYYREMSALLNSGVTAEHAALVVLEHTNLPVLRRAVGWIRETVLAGGKISEAMSEFPYLFTEIQVEMIKAGEMTGNIGSMMSTLSEYLEQELEVRQAIKRETFYPKFTLFMVLPLTSAADYILKGPKAYFNEAFMPMIYVGLIVLAIYMFCRYAFRFKPFRYAYDTVKAFLPTFGWTVRLMAFSKFTRALSALYTAGVFIPTALSISGRVCGNQFIRSNVDTVVSSVKAGEKISTGMRKTRQFPPLMVSMLETAEESGNMSELLDKVTQYYDSEAKMRLHTTCITLGILATVVVGIIVGIKVVEFYSGYFNALLSM